MPSRGARSWRSGCPGLEPSSSAPAARPERPSQLPRRLSRTARRSTYPFRRVPGDLELDLPDGTGDERYLEEVARLLPEALRRSRPELAFYLAGADPYLGDRLGQLALSKAGLAARDATVRDTLRAEGVPVCVTLAGGYAEDIRDTVEINLGTVTTFSG